MFGFSSGELFIIGLLALVVIGPKDLPRVLRELGKFTAKGRAMARTFRAGFDDMMREAEVDEIRSMGSLEHMMTGPKPAEPVVQAAALDTLATPPHEH